LGWAFAALLVGVAVAWTSANLSPGGTARGGLRVSQRDDGVSESGKQRVRRVTTLIAFAVLAPIVAFVVLVALLLLAKLSEPIMESVHLPTWCQHRRSA